MAPKLDASLPTSRGPAPGNGTLVAAVRATTTAEPHMVGKPGAALFDLARHPLGTAGQRLEPDQAVIESQQSIHAAATAAAIPDALPASAVQVINDRSAQGRPAAILPPEGKRRWRLSSASCVEDALSVIAADAISILAGERDGKLALCASPTCQAAFETL